MMNDDLEYRLYVLSEIAYEREFNNIDKKDLYPADWYGILNYNLKIQIIEEALEKKCLIKETEGYKSTIEGVVLEK